MRGQQGADDYVIGCIRLSHVTGLLPRGTNRNHQRLVKHPFGMAPPFLFLRCDRVKHRKLPPAGPPSTPSIKASSPSPTFDSLFFSFSPLDGPQDSMEKWRARVLCGEEFVKRITLAFGGPRRASTAEAGAWRGQKTEDRADVDNVGPWAKGGRPMTKRIDQLRGGRAERERRTKKKVGPFAAARQVFWN